MAGYGLFCIEITKNYVVSDWRDDLRKLIKQAGVDGTSMVFLFGDHQIKVSKFSLYFHQFIFIEKVYGIISLIRANINSC